MISPLKKVICPKTGQLMVTKVLELENDFHFEPYKSVIEIAEVWQKIANDHLFFSIPYLNLLESYPLEDTQNRYLVIYRQDEPIAIVFCQLRHFRLKQSLKQQNNVNSMLAKASNWAKNTLAGRIEFDALVCGNLSLTGEYGFKFAEDSFSFKEKFELIEKTLVHFLDYLKIVENIEVSVTLAKDFYQDKQFKLNEIDKSLFTEFCVQPTMILELEPEWKEFEDYLSAMSSKYRVRARRAMKKSEGIERRLLSWSEINQYGERMYELYMAISDNAGFNIMSLHPHYFRELKRSLPTKVNIFGYFKKQKLVAFNTVIRDRDILEAHFLGYDDNFNREHQIYLNMLYDIIREGIKSGVKEIGFSRTALEIKSSVGAVGHDMYCYLKHRQSLSNKMVPKLLKYFAPNEKWTPRSPFKNKEKKSEAKVSLVEKST